MFEAPCAFHAQMPAHFTDQHQDRLDALMTWPSNDRRAMQYARRRMVDQYAALQEAESRAPLLTTSPGFLDAKRMCWEFLEGWDGILSLPAKEELEAEYDALQSSGRRAGATFCILYWCHQSHATQLNRPISLSQVWKWIDQYGAAWVPIHATKDRLDEDWEQFKPVAHLWAAEYAFFWLGCWNQRDSYFASQWQSEILPMLPREDLDSHPDEVNRVIAIMDRLDRLNHRLKYVFSFAHQFQEFGFAFTPKRSRKPLLDRDRLVFLEEVPDWGIQLPVVEFPDEWIDSINSID